MAYEVSTSVGAGTNYFQEVSASNANKKYAAVSFSPDGTKFAVATERFGSESSDNQGLDIFTSSSASGWEQTEYVDTDAGGSVYGHYWKSSSEIIAVSAGRSISPYLSSSGGWTIDKEIANSSAMGSPTMLFPNFDGSRFLATDSVYVDIYTTGASGWTKDDSVNGNLGEYPRGGIAWIDNNTVAVGTPRHSSNRGKVYIFGADNAADTTFTEISSHTGTNPNDYFGQLLYYHSSSDAMIVGSGAQYLSSGHKGSSDISGRLDLYQSSSEGYLPSDLTNRTVLSSSMLTPYGQYTVRDSSTEDRFYFLTKGRGQYDANNDATNSNTGDLIAVESGSSGWVLTTIDREVHIGDSEAIRSATMPAASGQVIVANDKHNNNTTSEGAKAFKVHYVNFNLPSPALSLITTSSIGADGGLAKAGNSTNDPDAQVNVPASALSGDTSIIVKIKQTASDKADAVTEIKQLASVPKGGRASSDIVALEPHGQTFTSDAIVSFNVTGSTSNMKIYRRANASSAWEEVDTSYYSFSGGQVHVTSSTF